MHIEITADADALAIRAADLICDAARTKADALLGLPTGNTPIAAFAEIARRVAAGTVSFERATIYAVVVFAGATRTTPGTNSVFYRIHVNVGQRALHCPNPAALDPDEHIRAFADAIRRGGGLDLCVLGIGENGHIAFNEPGSARASRARVVDLAPTSRAAHAAAFGSLEAVPWRGITLGVADLLEARTMVVLASGRTKAAIVARAIHGEMTADVPASWLQTHPNITWLLDEDAAAVPARSATSD
jgi:glucosamine-6-phosphate deaminase